MAIKINVPGVGDVIVEGAAEEDTMQDILKAIESSNKTKNTNDDKLAKAKKREADATNQLNSELDDLVDNIEDLDEEARRTRTTFKSLGTDLKDFGIGLSKTAATVAVSFIKSYDSMAENPIKVGAALMNTMIDITAEISKIAIAGTTGLVGGLLKWIPFIGDSAAALADRTKDLGQGFVTLSATMAKFANQILADEFTKRVTALKNFYGAGASFAGGMTEMATIANDSGLGILAFSNVIKASREDITNLGLSASEATKLLSGGLNRLATTTGRSGLKLREELLAIGVSYEDQGQVMAQFMAVTKASGDRRVRSDTEVAQGTVEYAKQLKVLTDLTGQNAKAATEAARKEMLKGDILAQLRDPAEAAKFMETLKYIPEDAKLGFMEFVSTGGKFVRDTATNIVLTQNKELGKLFQGAYQNIRDPSKKLGDALDYVWNQSGRVGQASREAADQTLPFALRMNALSGDTAKAAQMMNAFNTVFREPGEYAKSLAATEAQSTANDAVTKGYVEATNSVVNFQVEMEKLATKLLPDYAKMIAKTTTQTLEIVGDSIKMLRGDMSMKEFGAKYAGLGGGSGAGPTAGSGPNDGTGLPGDRRTNAQKAAQDAEVKSGSKAYNALGFDQPNIDPYERRRGKKYGGISSGPVSGYTEVLHGTEAVVPLPDNRSIPVTLDSSSITNAMTTQTEHLARLITAMEKNNTLTSGILQNTY